MRPVHPRVSGDYNGRTTTTCSAYGPRPRRRGPPRCRRRPRRRLRLTPASAETTLSTTVTSTGVAAHPHVGGDHSAPRPSPSVGIGSPSRRRRPLQLPHASVLDVRITPAPAGTTIGQRARAPPPPALPRVGEDHAIGTFHLPPGDGSLPRRRGPLPLAARDPPMNGSPPRRRGPRSRCGVRRLPRRLTPASAESTAAHPPTQRSRAVHPRIGGDYGGYNDYRVELDGSPPTSAGNTSSGTGPG